MRYVPVRNWTVAEEDSKRVEIAGVDDKKQLTAVFAGTKSGNFLPHRSYMLGRQRNISYTWWYLVNVCQGEARVYIRAWS